MAESDKLDDDGGVSGESSDVELGECGACRAQIPIDSSSCPECEISFSGVTSEELGECGSCGELVPLNSSSCPGCGVNFILDDLVSALRQWLEQKSITVSILFNEVDADGDGVLTADEVKQALSGRNLSFLGADELDRFLMQIDLDRDGTISFGELAAALMIPMGVSSDDDEPSEPEDEVEETGEAPEQDAAPSVDDYSFSEDVLSKILDKHDISDRDAFLEHAMAFDEDGNLYLKKSELEKAAEAFEAPEEAVDEEVEETEAEADDANADDDTAAEPDEDDDDDPDDGDADDDEDTDDDESDVDEDTDDESDVDEDTDDESDVDEDTDDDDADDDEDSDDDDADDDEDSDEGDTDEEEEEVEEVDTGPSKLQIWLMRNEENVFPVGWAALGLALVAVLINIYGFFASILKCDEGDNAWLLEQEWCAEHTKLNLLGSFSPSNPASWSEAGSWGIPDIIALLIVIGLLAGSIYLRMQVTAWKANYRKKQDGDGEDESDDTDEEQDSDADEEPDQVEADPDSDDDDDDEEEDDEDDEEEVDDEDDEIDVGSNVGVEHDGMEYTATIIEFDDEEDEVLVRRDDDDEEVWVPFDSLFLE